MGYTCDFCSQQRSLVYCRSDSACLCLSCDRQVHSANALSRRHSRTLLCERCNAHAAVFRCVEEKICLCQNCDSSGHRASTSASTHNRQTINCYSGCPSPAEFSTFWSFFSNVTAADDSSCEHGLSLMSISKDSVEDCLVPADTNSKVDGTAAVEVNNVLNLGNSSVWTGSCSIAHPHCAPDSVDEMARSLLAGSPNSTLPKMQLPYPGTKGFGPCKDDDLYEDLNMDEVDLNFENYEELFGVALSHSEQLLENGGFDSLFGTKDMSGANSHCQGAAVSEDASGEVVKSMQPACSNGASVDSVMSSKTEPTHCFTSRPVQSALSFSGLTGECSAGDYQDCGASSMLLMGEPQWCPPCSESSLPSSIRSSAVMRYKEKKKIRKFEKKVRYASRKARADVRKRVKGRFVKTGDAYDYDPLTQTRSY